MKIEKITDNKIRIIINIDELHKKNIDIHTLASNREKAHILFQSILDEAEKQVGFKVQDCKLLIEAFSSSEGYIVFTLTKYKNQVNMEKSSKNVRFRRKSISTAQKNAIYKFNLFEEFCNFCTYCENSNLSDLSKFAKNISLYEYKNSYYLIFSEININFEKINNFYSSISEFSYLVSNSIVFRSKLCEYGKAVFKTNAIKNGIKYFSDITL